MSESPSVNKDRVLTRILIYVLQISPSLQRYYLF